MYRHGAAAAPQLCANRPLPRPHSRICCVQADECAPDKVDGLRPQLLTPRQAAEREHPQNWLPDRTPVSVLSTNRLPHLGMLATPPVGRAQHSRMQQLKLCPQVHLRGNHPEQQQ